DPRTRARRARSFSFGRDGRARTRPAGAEFNRPLAACHARFGDRPFRKGNALPRTPVPGGRSTCRAAVLAARSRRGRLAPRPLEADVLPGVTSCTTTVGRTGAVGFR